MLSLWAVWGVNLHFGDHLGPFIVHLGPLIVGLVTLATIWECLTVLGGLFGIPKWHVQLPNGNQIVQNERFGCGLGNMYNRPDVPMWSQWLTTQFQYGSVLHGLGKTRP